MNAELFDELNEIYWPIVDKSVEIKDRLINAGFIVKYGFYHDHYVRAGDDFAVEHFPIPVISVEGMEISGLILIQFGAKFI